ncbi:MAG: aminoacetone oxidase family FAD-binding enzyme [Clostridiales bacterium]|nr:aminoacetone oxidase family FAD-binding enzyme [Clostridiales bacterium]
MATIIIGAGAAGLACAITLGRLLPQEKITVLDRCACPGKKLYATGGGRCNLTNTAAGNFAQVKEFFKSIGVPLRIDGEGRAYPYCERADAVVCALSAECERLGIEIICSCEVTKIEKGFKVHTEKGIFKAERVVLAAGGAAQKNLGSNGSGYKLAAALGHSTTQILPALVQLTSSSRRIKALAGVRAKCRVGIELAGKEAGCECGEVLFTDYGLSGIVIMNLSEIVSKNFAEKDCERCVAIIDFAPDADSGELFEYAKRFGGFAPLFGKKISDMLVDEAQGDLEKAALYAKRQKVIITGTKGLDFAQITSGGIRRCEINNFKSLKCSGLYICGEIIDCQFACGGFNLDFAWHSGIEAAKQIYAEKNDDKN